MKTRASVLLVLALAIPNLCAAYGGKITYVQGEVTSTSRGKTGKSATGSAVKAGDAVKTGAGSLAILTMEDGAVLKLGEQSELAVPEKTEGEVQLNSGSVFSKIPKQKLNHQFKVRTATAVMGVRGTQFFTSFGKQSQSGADLWMCVNEGAVQVESLAGGKEVLVREGEGVIVPAGKDVTPPKAYSWTKSLNWNMDPAAGEVVDKTVIKYEGSLLKEEYD